MNKKGRAMPQRTGWSAGLEMIHTHFSPLISFFLKTLLLFSFVPKWLWRKRERQRENLIPVCQDWKYGGCEPPLRASPWSLLQMQMSGPSLDLLKKNCQFNKMPVIWFMCILMFEKCYIGAPSFSLWLATLIAPEREAHMGCGTCLHQGGYVQSEGRMDNLRPASTEISIGNLCKSAQLVMACDAVTLPD